MPRKAKAGSVVVEGHRIGIQFHTKAGFFRNGDHASPEIIAALAADGYKFREATSAEAEIAAEAAASVNDVVLTDAKNAVKTPKSHHASEANDGDGEAAEGA
jgi:hypothetical protein